VKRLFKIAILASAAAFPAFAQDTASPVNQYPVGGATDQTQPQEVVKATFGDWEVRCTNGGNTCFMYQLVLKDDGTPIAELSMVKLPLGSEAVAGVTLVAPLGTLLTQGVQMQVDDADASQYPFSWCTRPGCFARFGITDLVLNSMKSGQKITVALFSIADGQTPVTASASLKGFTEAFDSLDAPTQ